MKNNNNNTKIKHEQYTCLKITPKQTNKYKKHKK